MKEKALVGIDIQNDITKNYKEIIENINAAVGWAVDHDIHVVYIKHNNLSDGIKKSYVWEYERMDGDEKRKRLSDASGCRERNRRRKKCRARQFNLQQLRLETIGYLR